MTHRIGVSLLTALFSSVPVFAARAHDLGSAVPHPHPHPAAAGSPEAVFTLVLFTTLIGLAGLAFARRRESLAERRGPRRVALRPER